MRIRIFLLIVLCVAIGLILWFPRSRNPAIDRPIPSAEVVPPSPDTVSHSSPESLPSSSVARPADSPPRFEIATPIPRKADARIPAPAPAATPASLATATVVTQSPSAPGRGPSVSSEAVAIDVDKVTLSLRDYRTVMGENPVGTNAEITRALNGGNAKQARLLPEGQSVNGSGELVDQWGTPYFFHQLSKIDMEVRSAGPDKIMWTGDDVIAR